MCVEKVVFSVMSIFNIFGSAVKELENASNQLEKEYTELEKKETANKKLNKELKEINVRLKKKLKEKETAISKLYNQISNIDKNTHLNEIQQIEHNIAGGFAHKIRNLYNPMLLLINKISNEAVIEKCNDRLLNIVNILKQKLSKNEFNNIISIVDDINNKHKMLKEIFSISYDAVKKDLNLIEQFLNYTSIQKDMKLINISDLINSVIDKNKNLLLENSINFKLDVKNKKSVLADHMQLFIVIQNLLLNAIKAVNDNESKKGKKISIKSYDVIPKKQVVVEVSDNGIGISKENMDNIFKPFFTTNKKSGLGLGLALCRKILEMYEAKIEVKSKPGVGSTFIITFSSRENPNV